MAADEAGNFAIADRQLNLLLVVVVPARGQGRGFWEPAWIRLIKSADRHRTVLRLSDAGLDDVQIRRATDALIVVLPDGTTLTNPLKTGDADRLHRQLLDAHGMGDASGTTIMVSAETALGPEASEARALMRRAQQAFEALPPPPISKPLSRPTILDSSGQSPIWQPGGQSPVM